MEIKNIGKLVISFVAPQVAGLIGSVFTVSSVTTWYAELARPALNPPNWIFGPVWITLYFLMGAALFIVWSSYDKAKDDQDRKKIKIALNVFAIQLFLNALWSIIFFGLRDPFWAFVEIIILWLAILWTIFSFHKISRLATWLLLPYIIWVSFAMYLNYSIWLLN